MNGRGEGHVVCVLLVELGRPGRRDKYEQYVTVYTSDFAGCPRVTVVRQVTQTLKIAVAPGDDEFQNNRDRQKAFNNSRVNVQVPSPELLDSVDL